MKTEEISSPISQSSFTPVPLKKTESQALDQNISASDKQGAEIEIFTKEGDKVTLSFNSSSQTQYSNTENLTYDSSGSLNYQKNEQFAYSSQSELSIFVEGDLSSAEQKDIHKAIQTMKNAMNNFFGESSLDIGNISDKFSKLGTLSGLEASFSYEKSLSVVEKYEKASTTSYVPHVEYDDDEGDDDDSKHIPAPNTIDQLVSKLTEQIESTKIDPQKFEEPIGGLFEHFSKKIEDSLFTSEKNKANELLTAIRAQLDENIDSLNKLFHENSDDD